MSDVDIRIGIIGGSGLYDMAELTDREERTLTDAVRRAVRALRHRPRCAAGAWRSSRATAPGTASCPSELNFRANIYGFKTLGVERILSASAVGSLRRSTSRSTSSCPTSSSTGRRGASDVLRARAGGARRLRASRLPDLAALAYAPRRAVGATVHKGGTYVCMEGPQFSTLAESKLYRSWGMDVIGMTNLQEAKLAREAEICYATIALVTDYDCWHPEHDSGHRRDDHRQPDAERETAQR